MGRGGVENSFAHSCLSLLVKFHPQGVHSSEFCVVGKPDPRSREPRLRRKWEAEASPPRSGCCPSRGDGHPEEEQEGLGVSAKQAVPGVGRQLSWGSPGVLQVCLAQEVSCRGATSGDGQGPGAGSGDGGKFPEQATFRERAQGCGLKGRGSELFPGHMAGEALRESGTLMEQWDGGSKCVLVLSSSCFQWLRGHKCRKSRERAGDPEKQGGMRMRPVRLRV